MLKKFVFVFFVPIFMLILISCEGVRNSGNSFTPVDPCNPDNDEIPVYNNDFFYLFSDSAKISDDSTVFYANGLEFDGGFSGTAVSRNITDCVVDGSEALLIRRGEGKWSAGGWIGLADQPLDLSEAENLVFFAKSQPGQINGSFKVKMESINGSSEVDSGFDIENVDGGWKKIEIPLSQFKGNGFDLTEVKSPFIFVMNDMMTGDFIYIDCIYFDGPVKTPGKVSLDFQSYNIDATEAVISIVDPGSVGNPVSVTVENGADAITIENIIIDGNGQGEALLNFGAITDDNTDTLAVSIGDVVTIFYVDSIAVSRTDEAVIVPEGTMEGDINFDGKVYIYSSSETVDLERGVDYKTHHWDTFSTFDFKYTEDDDFSPVLEVQSGKGWGGTPICISFHSFEVSFSGYNNLNFKFKSDDYINLTIKFPGSTLKAEEINYSIDNYEIIENTDGWYEVSIPLSDFEDVSESDTIGIFQNSDAGTFYLTDIYFN